MIKIATILGSTRPGNFTAQALAVVQDEIKKASNVELIEINPTKLNLAMPGIATQSSDSQKMIERVKDATAVVLSTPEYHGSYSSVIKLVIDNLGFPSSLSTKPVALLGVAAGQIGAIKALEHLRSVCSHVGSIVLPGPVSVARVQAIFDDQGKCLDESTEKRLRGLATNLIHYIHNNICPKFALEQMVRGDSQKS